MNAVLPLILIGSLVNPEYVTCSLWKRTEGIDGKVCIYRGANGTIAYHYAQRSYTECPRQFQCKYLPNSKKKPSLEDILDGLKDGFK